MGVLEIALLLLVLILFFGARRIPTIARGLGEGIRNFRKSVKEGEEEDQDRSLPGGQDS